MRLDRSCFVVSALAGLIAVSGIAMAEVPVSPELVERMAKEKEARKACKIDICNAFAKPDASAGPIQCDMTKTWVASTIQTRILGDRLSWPWGHAQCSAKVNIDRGQVAGVMTKPEGTLELEKHTINCQLDQKDASKGAAYKVQLSIKPKVTFVKGKATKVSMNWSDIKAPTLAKAAIWSATSMDSMLGVLSGGVVKEINSSLYEKCKDEGITLPEMK